MRSRECYMIASAQARILPRICKNGGESMAKVQARLPVGNRNPVGELGIWGRTLGWLRNNPKKRKP